MPKARLPAPDPGLARASHRDRAHRATEIVDRLIELHAQLLATLDRGDTPDLEAFNTACQRHQRDLGGLGDLPPDPTDAGRLRQNLQRLGVLNRQTQIAIQKQLSSVQDRLLNLRTGRRTLAGYERAAVAGRRPGSLLGRG